MPKSFDIQRYTRPVGSAAFTVPNPVCHIANPTVTRLAHIRVTQASLMEPSLCPVGINEHVTCHCRHGPVLAAKDIPHGFDPEYRLHVPKERILPRHPFPQIVSGGPVQEATYLEGGRDGEVVDPPLAIPKVVRPRCRPPHPLKRRDQGPRKPPDVPLRLISEPDLSQRLENRPGSIGVDV